MCGLGTLKTYAEIGPVTTFCPMQYVVDPPLLMTARGWLFVIIVGVLLPLGALRQHRRMTAGTPIPARARLYVSGMFTHAIFLALVWSASRDFSQSLLAPYRPRPLHVALGLASLALGLLPLLPRFRIDNPAGRARSLLLAARTGREFLLFAAVCLTAGIAEELAYRGVLFTLLSTLLRGWWVPAIVSAAMFGIVHLFQGWKSAGIAGLLGLRDQIVVGLTGTVFVVIVTHVLHDLVTGVVVSARARRDDLVDAAGSANATESVSAVS